MEAGDAPGAVSQKPKRGSRACLRCRAGKRQCDGDDQCNRCRRGGYECVYDKILVKAGEGNLEDEHASESSTPSRLANIEAQLAALDRRQDLILMALTDLTATLKGAQVQGQRGPATQTLNTSLDGISPVSSANCSGTSSSKAASLMTVGPGTAPRSSDNFALSLHAPMQAMEEAEAEPESDRRKTDGSLDLHDDGQDASEKEDEGPGPAKRVKLTILSESSWAHSRPDIVTKGRMTEREARSLVFFWMKELSPFCSILDRKYDTFQSLRQRSPFLLNAIVYTALRAKTGASKPSRTVIAAAEEARTLAMHLILDRFPSVETIQALVVIASWHEDPYLVSGFAQRLALSARYDRVDEDLERQGWNGTAEETRSLMMRLRVWSYCYFLDSRHSRSSGRPVMQHDSDLQRMLACAAGLLSSPLLSADDVRVVSYVRLVVIERQIELAAKTHFQSDFDFSERLEYIQQTRGSLKEWHETHDAHLARFAPDPQEWCRRSHYRHFHDVNLFLSCTVLKASLVDPQAPPAVRDISHAALGHSLAIIREVLRSHVYSSMIQYSGFLTRIDVSFAALASLKLARLFPDAPELQEVASDVQGIIDLLAPVPSAQRYVLVLKKARRQFLEEKEKKVGIRTEGSYPSWIGWAQETISIPHPTLPGEIDWLQAMADIQGGEGSLSGMEGQVGTAANAWPDYNFAFSDYLL